jgi:hypothetical protein
MVYIVEKLFFSPFVTLIFLLSYNAFFKLVFFKDILKYLPPPAIQEYQVTSQDKWEYK